MKHEEDKLSRCVTAMAESILVRSPDQVSGEAGHAALVLASVAWNREVDARRAAGKGYLQAIMEIEHRNSAFRRELKSVDCEALIEGMQQFKRSHYPSDTRFILVCESRQNGNVRVAWAHGNDSRDRPIHPNAAGRKDKRQRLSVRERLAQYMAKHGATEAVDQEEFELPPRQRSEVTPTGAV